MSPELVRQLQTEIEAMGSDSHRFFGGSHTGGIYLQQNPVEAANLISFLKSMYFETFLEIGSAGGGMIKFLDHYLNFKEIVSMDLGIHHNADKFETVNKSIMSKITRFKGDSHSELAKQFLEKLGAKYSLVFIDGDHSFEGVKKDIELVLPYLKQNSAVMFHDTVKLPEVKKAVDCYEEYLKPIAHFVDNKNPFGILVTKFK